MGAAQTPADDTPQLVLAIMFMLQVKRNWLNFKDSDIAMGIGLGLCSGVNLGPFSIDIDFTLNSYSSAQSFKVVREQNARRWPQRHICQK